MSSNLLRQITLQSRGGTWPIIVFWLPILLSLCVSQNAQAAKGSGVAEAKDSSSLAKLLRKEHGQSFMFWADKIDNGPHPLGKAEVYQKSDSC